MDSFPNPLDIDRSVFAVVLKKRNGDSRNCGGFHMRKGSLEYGQTTDADNGFDLTSLDQRHHQSGSLSNQHSVTQTLGFRL
jgi:hypothetical protein